MSPQIEIQLIGVLVAVSCALPGTFLVLRGMAMMADAITHTILLGIVLAFFATGDLSSPWLILAAAMMGVATVFLTQLLHSTKLLKEDAATGMIFPLLFSIAVILISRYGGAAHLDTDSVLMGELAFAPFDRMLLFGVDIGAKALYVNGILLLLNLTFVMVFFKELKISTFDPALAAIFGFMPGVLHYALMSLVSLTTVGAFSAVGSVLVVAFMTGPAITAYLLTFQLKRMILFSAMIGAFNAVVGYQLAALLDVSIAGAMAVITGLSFFVVFIFAPGRGLLQITMRRRRQKMEFAGRTLLFHLYHHEGKSNEAEEASAEGLYKHLKWKENTAKNIIRDLQRQKYIFVEQGMLKLTPEGRSASRQMYKELYTI